MGEDNEGWRMLYRQFKGDCKNQSAPLAAHEKALISYGQRAKKVEDQAKT